MVPYYNAEYERYGSNQGGIIFIEAHSWDSESKTKAWVDQYGCKYPVVSGPAGGTAIFDGYEQGYHPRIFLVAPDQKVVEEEIKKEDLKTTLEKYNFTGIKQNMAYNPSDFAIGKVSPQKITINAPIDGEYNLSLYSVNGKMVKNLFNRYMTKGEHTISWNKNRFSKGVFLIQLHHEDVIKTKKVVLN